jgi:hypothetical protein
MNWRRRFRFRVRGLPAVDSGLPVEKDRLAVRSAVKLRTRWLFNYGDSFCDNM